ncbi:uncharacterized protein F5891DRAFT_1030928 [Suillus fuscotomentosus]|uniref:Septation protein imp2 n=1 Tax=Suillus fuscotomentosus TaxID=1912939 RepID=A0AAD4HLG2_9AGAM|nr:uncharacterized protein F5891DRAFT_1030928 [Suillus fuscotomentosus]KAG1900958.1 hypothetical protein F5891DRAFT_1030928 [Suillus fuscotomentosus]
MSARRQSSTTSLAKYARTTSPDTNIRSLDFCNSFWGVGDGGVDVLFARMRGAARTMEELRNFWKERSAIEEDYAKRLAKLAKMSIGKDEIGELRNSVDTLRLETDKQAGFHLQLSQQIRNDLEGQAAAFSARQQHHKKTYQAAIEKEYKVKQTREQHASKAREKYESDCLRINSYTAQSTLVQGKDLEKIHLKLERAQQTVQVNENDYAQFTRVLQETMQKWEQDWKAFCDTCQDLEEERMEFMKDNMWAYANSVSTVCVSDDESCEKMRLALEQMEPEKEMENFVRDYATGNAIPEAPAFVNYTSSDAVPSSSTRIATRPATYARISQRSSAGRSAPPPEPEDYDDTNHAGVGAIGAGSRSSPAESTLARSQTQKSQSARSQTNGVNGHVSPLHDVQPQPPQAQRRDSTASALRPMQEPRGDSVGPAVSNTQLVIGGQTWNVDPNKDPQQQRGQPRTSPPVGEQNDPLVRQMAELSTAAQNLARRPTVRRDTLSGQDPRKATTESLVTPSSVYSGNRDFRNSAEVVVGSYPLAPSRSSSPNPPKPVLAAPPPSLPPPSSNLPVEQVLNNYGRVFPGEQRSRSRANSFVGPPPPVNNHQTQDPNGVRPTSRGGYPGVGTQNLGPQPPAGPLVRQPSIAQRPVTPNNPVGIALGPDGRVVVDHMAHQPPRQPPYVQAQPPSTQSYPGYHNNDSRQPQPQPRADYGTGTTYAAPAPQPQSYNNYNHPPQRPQYDSQPVVPYQPPPPPSQPYNNYGPPARNPSIVAHPSQGTINHQHPQQPYYGHNTNNYRAPSPVMARTPSPQLPRHPPPPTGAYTDDGRPILFYVKALYDYAATIDEEFDFQAGDIIAVTDTPEDGWWSGELLDEIRRQAGRHVFPSNFVCLF